MRPLLLLLLVLLTACAGAPPESLPLPSQPPREPTLALPALLGEPQRWSGRQLTLVAPALLRDGERVLTPQLNGAVDPRSTLWLAEPPPDAVVGRLEDGVGVLKLRGRLSPPGAFGRDQRYAYQFLADEVDVLDAEPTTVVNLADNPRALDGLLLTVEGTLLLRDDSALLVDRVTAGGVPEADARQLKLPRSSIDASVAAALERSGEVGWGPVRVTGWWQDAKMTPFAVEPSE